MFPDGELLEVGSVVTAIQRAGFEARHLESLREHYALTLRAWSANLERGWDEAVAEVGAPAPGSGGSTSRRRLNFEDGGTRPVPRCSRSRATDGRSGHGAAAA